MGVEGDCCFWSALLAPLHLLHLVTAFTLKSMRVAFLLLSLCSACGDLTGDPNICCQCIGCLRLEMINESKLLTAAVIQDLINNTPCGDDHSHDHNSYNLSHVSTRQRFSLSHSFNQKNKLSPFLAEKKTRLRPTGQYLLVS